jgi:glucosamine--fructose-6-phosphate aminotransferase (isomerizing)
MCGIVGAVAERNIVPVLMEGLRRLEYRGYDSAGIAVLNGTKHLTRLRTVGKVRMLDEALAHNPTEGPIGIAHTRWATHGVPSERNAHPHISRDGIAIVHNGIIENHEELRADLERRGYEFSSETDTEVIAHRVHYHLQTVHDLFKAVRATVAELEGAYALVVVSEHDPDRLILAREGCPVVVGLGVDENFVASDVAALLPVTRRFIFLEEGDVAEVRRTSSTATAPSSSERCGRASCRRMRPRRALSRTTCSRRSTSSRARSPTPCRSGSPTGACSKRRSVRRPPRS